MSVFPAGAILFSAKLTILLPLLFQLLRQRGDLLAQTLEYRVVDSSPVSGLRLVRRNGHDGDRRGFHVSCCLPMINCVLALKLWHFHRQLRFFFPVQIVKVFAIHGMQPLIILVTGGELVLVFGDNLRRAYKHLLALAFQPQDVKKERDYSGQRSDIDPEKELVDAALDCDPARILDALAKVRVLAVELIQKIKRVPLLAT